MNICNSFIFVLWISTIKNVVKPEIKLKRDWIRYKFLYNISIADSANYKTYLRPNQQQTQDLNVSKQIVNICCIW